MNNIATSRYLLYALLAAFIAWLLWLLPLPKTPVPVTSTRHAAWQLPSMQRPPDPQALAMRLALRQGWQTVGKEGSARSAAAKQKILNTKILGIVQPEHGLAGVLILLSKGHLQMFRVGEALPDGRRITAIQGANVTLAPAKGHAGKPRKVHLFPFQAKHLSVPKVVAPTGES